MCDIYWGKNYEVHDLENFVYTNHSLQKTNFALFEGACNDHIFWFWSVT